MHRGALPWHLFSSQQLFACPADFFSAVSYDICGYLAENRPKQWLRALRQHRRLISHWLTSSKRAQCQQNHIINKTIKRYFVNKSVVVRCSVAGIWPMRKCVNGVYLEENSFYWRVNGSRRELAPFWHLIIMALLAKPDQQYSILDSCCSNTPCWYH